MKTLSANHLSYVSGGLNEDVTVVTPDNTVVDVTTTEEKASWTSYLPSLKNAAIGLGLVVLGLIGGYFIGGKGGK